MGKLKKQGKSRQRNIVSHLSGKHCVLHQHGDRHGADASRYGRDAAGNFFYFSKVHVTAKLAGFVAVHTDVDHNGTGLDHVGLDELVCGCARQ